MKYSTKALFSAILIFSTQIHAIILDQSVIDKKAIEIEKKLTRERYLMYGFTTIAVAHEIYQWTPVLQFLFGSRSVVEKKEEISFLNAIKEGARQTFYTKEGWNSLFQSAFSLSLGITGIVIISQMGEQYIHPNTLRWYITAYAPYEVTIKLIKERLRDLRNPFIDQQGSDMNNEMIHLLYNGLITQAISMSAYMAYKVKSFDVAEKIVGERAKASLLKVHHKWLGDIESQLNSPELDYTQIESLLDAYAQAIGVQVSHFALVEGETRRERAVVKKQMKQKLSDQS